MATMTTDGLAELALSFEEIAKLGDDVLRPMLEAEGRIVMRAQERTANSMLSGPYSTGALAKSLKLGKYRRKNSGASMSVTFSGKQHGTRLAEIAFYNEFGTRRGQKARPFIRTANEACADEAVDAAAKVYDEYLSSKGL